MSLSFKELREANVRRCEESFHPLNDWTPSDWSNALAGECGEACNEIKKMLRISPTPEALASKSHVRNKWSEPDEMYESHRLAVAKELADVVAYADLLAARLGIDLGEAVRQKFNEVSAKVGSMIKLGSKCCGKCKCQE